MGQPIIELHNISKRYRLGTSANADASIGEAIGNALKYPIRNLHRLKSLSKFDEGEEDESILWALKDISFDVQEQEVVGLIGKNGAGKSTLLKVLSRITPPTTGSITMRGRVASLLEVGTGFHKELTGRENVYLNGTLLGMKKSEVDEKFDQIVDFSGIRKFLDTPVKRYSSGMMVRLAFSVAAHLDPEILIIDEVLAVGDAEFQKRCLGKMQEVSQAGRTVLFVSHNMLAVQSFCTRAILLKNGRQIDDGTPQAIVSEYLKQYSNTTGNLYFEPEHAPGNEEASLLSAEVINMGDSEAIMTRDPFKLRFKFYRKHTDPAYLAVTFHLMDEMGTLIFVGTSTGELADEKFGAGFFTAECEVPRDLIQEGTYTITRLLLVKNMGSILYEHKDALSFEVAHKPLFTYGWMGGKEGAVNPRMDWDITFEQV